MTVLNEVSFTHLWVIAFLSTNISQGCVATRLRGGGTCKCFPEIDC